MFKKYKTFKYTLVTVTSIVVLLLIFGWWFMSLLPPKEMYANVPTTQVSDLPYLSDNIISPRGKILAVVTSTDIMGDTDKKTGYELTELSRAYYVFQANGFEVDIASPLGGKPPIIIDDEDMGEYDFAFLNDSIAQHKTEHTIAVKDINPEIYKAVFFVGGKGAMFDFPNNKDIQDIVRDFYQSNKVVGAVCHGPAALVNVILDNGRPLLENKIVSGFTNKEELLLISDAREIFPFLLQDGLVSKGARFNEGAMYLENISHDNNLVTGQNPWSTWILAETIIKQLGYSPKYREITAEENAIQVLQMYENQGADKAKELIEQICTVDHKPLARQLLAMHSVVGVMRGDISRFYNLLSLAAYAKKKTKDIVY